MENYISRERRRMTHGLNFIYIYKLGQARCHETNMGRTLHHIIVHKVTKESGSSCWLLCLSHAKVDDLIIFIIMIENNSEIKDFMANFGENQKEKIFFTQALTLPKPKIP
ncbi:hypothetical protein RDI58_017816 [Solanum bulbocastanum]|uniref:Uncharacterized protein n=1 Tax=Solanum bulbocastanum TaxID=147425 RepID=A0AAN8YAC0_SOLBU